MDRETMKDLVEVICKKYDTECDITKIISWLLNPNQDYMGFSPLELIELGKTFHIIRSI